MSATDREKQIAEAEELLGDAPSQMGFGKGLFFGRYLQQSLRPYPNLEANHETNVAVDELRQFQGDVEIGADRRHPGRIDRQRQRFGRRFDQAVKGFGARHGIPRSQRRMRNRRQQFASIVGLRRRQHSFGRPALYDLTGTHHNDAVA